MEILGDAPHERAVTRPNSWDDAPEVFLGDGDDEPSSPIDSTPAWSRPGPEPYAIAAAMLSVAALMGNSALYMVNLLGTFFGSGQNTFKAAVGLTSGVWAPGLLGLGFAVLAGRTSTPTTAAWVRWLRLGSLLAVSAMLVLAAIAIAYSTSQGPDTSAG